LTHQCLNCSHSSRNFLTPPMIVAPLHSNNVFGHSDGLKRKADALSCLQTSDILGRHVKRVKTSLEGDVYSNRASFLRSSNDRITGVTRTEETPEPSSPTRNTASLVSAIAAVASSELSLFPDIPQKACKVPPPPTIAISFSLPKAEHTFGEDKSSEEEIDYYLDLDLDPASEDAEDVNDEMWASSLLFFISQTPERERRERSPSPPAVPKSHNEVVVSSAKVESSARVASESKKCKQKMKRRRGHFPKTTTDLLKSWLFDHLEHPYPTEEEKAVLAEDTGLTVKQINYWFTNSRRRFLKTRG